MNLSTDIKEEMPSEFETDLIDVINRHSMENGESKNPIQNHSAPFMGHSAAGKPETQNRKPNKMSEDTEKQEAPAAAPEPPTEAAPTEAAPASAAPCESQPEKA